MKFMITKRHFIKFFNRSGIAMVALFILLLFHPFGVWVLFLNIFYNHFIPSGLIK